MNSLDEEETEEGKEVIEEEVPEKKVEGLEGREGSVKRKQLLLEKRFVDMELGFDELKQKIESLDPKVISEVLQRIEDLEDLALIDSLGVTEIKKMLEDVKKRYEEVASRKPVISMSPEDVEKITSSIMPVVQSSVSPIEKKVEEKLNEMSAEKEKIRNLLESIEKRYEELAKRKPVVSMGPEDLGRITSSVMPVIESAVLPKIEQKVEDRLKAISTESGIHLAAEDLDKSIADIKKEVGYLKDKIKPLETEVIQKIVSEIADLRTETGKEIMDIKDRIEGVGATKSDIDIKFLSSRVNALKENIDYLLNRKTETDMKIENLRKAVAKIAENAVSTDIIETIEKSKRVLVDLGNRIESIENSLKSFETAKTTGSEKLYKKIVDMYNEMNKELEEAKKLTTAQALKAGPPTSLDTQIDELLNRIIFLESRMRAIEKTLEKKDKSGPIILE